MINRLSSPAKLALALLMTIPMACGSDGGDGGGNGDGGVGDGDGGNNGGMVDANPNAPRTVYRASKLELRDPHVFSFFDATGTVNGFIQDGVDNDEDEPPDNILDLNVSIVFQPLDQVGTTTPMVISFAECSAPLATTSCTQSATTELIPATATNSDSGTCLEALAGTTTDYGGNQASPVIPVPAPCFSSNEVDVTVNLGTVTLPMKAARISATYSGTPATSLVTGLLRGYVTEADANNIIIPADVPLVGGDPLSSLLHADDRDTDPDGTPLNGWWFYIAMEAEEVTYTVQ